MGRRAGVATAFGVANGQAIWTFAASVGLSAVLVASEPMFVALKVAGALYLVFYRVRDQSGTPSGNRVGEGPRRLPGKSEASWARAPAYRRGLLSNLGNPKMVVVFSSLLPQFATQ